MKNKQLSIKTITPQEVRNNFPIPRLLTISKAKPLGVNIQSYYKHKAQNLKNAQFFSLVYTVYACMLKTSLTLT